MDREVIEEFCNDLAGLATAAAAVRDAAGDGSSPRLRRTDVADGLTTEHIEVAIREWWSLGRNAFMGKYGGRPAERYVIVTEFGDVDALALVLGARALAGLDISGPWRGDRTNVAEPLRALGFRVDIGGRETAREIGVVEQAVQVAAGRTERPSNEAGQGFMVDQKAKLAVEVYAMELALAHYTSLGTVVDTALRKSWDYEVDIAGDRWHVEVKGTTGDAAEVILTPNEVGHARTYPFIALYVVSNIVVRNGPNDECLTSGGRVTLLHPWVIDDGELRPLGYKYRLPDGPHA